MIITNFSLLYCCLHQSFFIYSTYIAIARNVHSLNFTPLLINIYRYLLNGKNVEIKVKTQVQFDNFNPEFNQVWNSMSIYVRIYKCRS